MPRVVRQATRLLWAGLLLPALAWPLEFAVMPPASHRVAGPTLLLGAAAIAVFWGWLTWQVGAGRRWARKVYLLISIVAVPLQIVALRGDIDRSLALALLNGLGIVATVVGLQMLHSRPADAWFGDAPR